MPRPDERSARSGWLLLTRANHWHARDILVQGRRPLEAFFSELYRLTAQSQAGTDTVELADAGGGTEALNNGTLDLSTRNTRAGLAVLHQVGEHLPAQFNRMAVALLCKYLLAFTLDALEQPIHGGTMHRNAAAPPRL